MRASGARRRAAAEVTALAPTTRRAPGVQADRHLRRRVRLADGLYVFDLCAAFRRRPCLRGASHRRAERSSILGGGPNRIGQGIEFDYCCCHASFALREARVRNDHDQLQPGDGLDRLRHVRPALFRAARRAEDVLEILAKESEAGELKGAIVQFGGQTPLKLAHALEQAGIPILGTSVDSIDLAEDRDRFKRLLDKIGLQQPKNGIAYSVEQSRLVAADLGLPLVVRPSYVLGGRAMAIIRDKAAFDDYLLGTLPGLVPSDVKARYPNDKTGQINTVLGKNPLLFDRYLSDAVEVDVDALCDGKDVFICGIMEHIEEAGIHSGDSACSLPPRSLSPAKIAELEDQTRKLALALGVGGLMNVQYALKDGEIYVLEVNPRAARTVPFVAKVDRRADRQDRGADHGRRKPCAASACGRRGSTTSASRNRCFRSPGFPASIPCSGRKCARPARSSASTAPSRSPSPRASSAAARKCRHRARCSFRCATSTSRACSKPCRLLAELGFKISATGGTARYPRWPRASRRSASTRSPRAGRMSSMSIKNGGIQLVLNTTEGAQALADSRSLRRAALLHKVPYYTTLAGAIAASQGIRAYLAGDLEVRALQDYFA